MIGPKLRTILTRFFLPFFWKKNNLNASLALKQFSEVEFDSAWQYFNAMNHVNSPMTQLMLFENILEEMEHSDAFLKSAHQLAARRLSYPQKARTVLVTSVEQMPYFLAFAHESEKAICSQFKGYAYACRHLPNVADVFKDIAFEEEKHEREAHVALVSLIGSSKSVNRLLWKVKINKYYKSWMRGTKHIGEFMFTVWLGVLYFIFSPFFCGYCKRRLMNEELTQQTNIEAEICSTESGGTK